MSNGPAVHGTCIIVDGVEQKHVSRAVLDLKAGDVARLELHTFTETCFDGVAEVEIVHFCPECRARLEKDLAPGMVATVETTPIGSKWKRYHVAAIRNYDGEIQR